MTRKNATTSSSAMGRGRPCGHQDLMAREPNGGLRDGALVVQEGKEALHPAAARRDRPGRQRVMEGGLDPGIHIRGGGLRQVLIEEWPGAPRASAPRNF